MTHILAILSNPTGRDRWRCWKGFIFDTIVQSEVEQFMLDMHHRKYFLCDPDELARNDAGRMLYQGLMVLGTEVSVKIRGVHTTFTIKT